MGRDRFTKANESYPCKKFAVGSHNPELCNFLIEAGADKNARDFNWYDPYSKGPIAVMMKSDSSH